MRFSVITPSLNQSDWLRLCVASVADQEVDVEHIIQDGGSTDGTLNWLLADKRVKAFVEKDQGMYDAVNRGLHRATGEVLAYLNCDEQYLPGALPMVRDFLQREPQIDVLFGDIVMVDARGEYLCHRKVQVPLKYHTWVCHLSTLTCATFFRRRLINEEQAFFDPNLRRGGDGEWMLRLLQRGIPMASLRQFTSVFTCTGDNLGRDARARQEWKQLRDSAPWWACAMSPVFVLHHRLRRLFDGSYFQKPFSYALYTRASPEKRVMHHVARPTFRCPKSFDRG